MRALYRIIDVSVYGRVYVNDHSESYHSFMRNNFFNHIDIKKENVHILNGNAKDLKAECENYEKAI